MPKINGREVLKSIKSAHPNVKVVVLTGSPLNRISPIAAESDDTVFNLADAVINKPCDIENLLSTINNAVKNSGNS